MRYPDELAEPCRYTTQPSREPLSELLWGWAAILVIVALVVAW